MIKAIVEFILLGLLCAVILLLCLKTIGEANWEEEHCKWNKNMEYVCDDK